MEKERFQGILNEVTEVHKRHSDFGADDFSSFRMCERMGVTAWKGVLVMMTEEMGRLMNMARPENPEVELEIVAEILTELAAHSIMARMLLEEPQSIKQPDYTPRRGRRPGQKEKKEFSSGNAGNLLEDSSLQTGES
jgi:hypothetical protein